MNKYKITKYAFTLADAISFIILFSSIIAFVSLLFPPVITSWEISSVSKSILSYFEGTNMLIGGIGFYLLLRRRVIGFALIILTIILDLIFSKIFFVETIYYLSGLLFVIALPWVLSYKEIVSANKT